MMFSQLYTDNTKQFSPYDTLSQWLIRPIIILASKARGGLHTSWLQVQVWYIIVSQVAAVAPLALLLATTGRFDTSLRYTFVIYVGMHQKEIIIRTMDWQSNRSCSGSNIDLRIQQSNHAAVYTLLYNFTSKVTMASCLLPASAHGDSEYNQPVEKLDISLITVVCLNNTAVRCWNA